MKMTRRQFFWILFVGIAGVAFGFLSLLAKKKTRDQLISQILSSKEGRQQLAKAMVEPIRRSLEYEGVGKKLLIVDYLP